jgi:hypothetical protein
MSGSVTNPRYQVLINGQNLNYVVAIEVSLPYLYNCGCFYFATTSLPSDLFSASWWGSTSTKSILVEIRLASDGVNYQSVITGYVDSYQYDPIGNVIHAVGRDLSALMLDKRLVTTYRNQSAADIARNFATEHNLSIISTPRPDLVGRFYDVDYDETYAGSFDLATNQWDLLCRLGSIAGVVPYVWGNTLYFNRPAQAPPVFNITFAQNAFGNLATNVGSIFFERQLSVARDVIVSVRSWHSKSKKTSSATIRTSSKIPESVPSTPTNYLALSPNLTQAQCLAKAAQLALDYSQHERVLTATIPSLALMTPQTVIEVSGTGTDFDMTYLQQGITYTIDFERGAMTYIRAKFSSDVCMYDEDTGNQIEKGAP